MRARVIAAARRAGEQYAEHYGETPLIDTNSPGYWRHHAGALGLDADQRESFEDIFSREMYAAALDYLCEHQTTQGNGERLAQDALEMHGPAIAQTQKDMAAEFNHTPEEAVQLFANALKPAISASDSLSPVLVKATEISGRFAALAEAASLRDDRTAEQNKLRQGRAGHHISHVVHGYRKYPAYSVENIWGLNRERIVDQVFTVKDAQGGNHTFRPKLPGAIYAVCGRMRLNTETGEMSVVPGEER